jgi:hypothetical protein
MSDSAQEKATEETGVNPVPGHHGGVPPLAEGADPDTSQADADADSAVPQKTEPRAGRDS